MLNDLFALLADVPPKTAMLWAAWLTAGLLLSMWQRRAERRLVVHPTSSARPKTKSGVKKPAGVRQEPQTYTTGDAFGELEKLLDEPTPSGMHRRPGDDVLRESATPALAGPRALP